MPLHLYPSKSLLLAAFLLTLPGARAQVINDAFDGAGNETYTGVNGFGAFNWVNAVNFGFSSQQGADAFLSNLTGNPIPDIGMIKTFGTLMENTTYRVSFYCSRYSSVNTLGIADYDTLYIGSRYGTMVWDTVPTPAVDFEWLRWSGVYTPAAVDIGQPFHFGFSLTLNNATSFALDGPVTATGISTGITHILDAPEDLVIVPEPGGQSMVVRASRDIAHVELFDARGALLAIPTAGHGMQWRIGTAAAGSSLYVVRVLMADGSQHTRRVMLD